MSNNKLINILTNESLDEKQKDVLIKSFINEQFSLLKKDYFCFKLPLIGYLLFTNALVFSASCVSIQHGRNFIFIWFGLLIVTGICIPLIIITAVCSYLRFLFNRKKHTRYTYENIRLWKERNEK